MSFKKAGLGRGLDALLGGRGTQTSPAQEKSHEVRTLPVDVIQRGRFQPRLDIKPETLQELADSIRAQGVVQPIVVRPLPGGNRYEIIAGERRWRASQLAGLHEIPVVVKDVTDQAAVSIALIENIQREDLNPLEEALSLSRLVNEFGLTHQAVADAVGRSRAAVSNLLRLIDLGETAKKLLETGRIEMGHARALLALAEPVQGDAARQIVQRGLSVRETERLVARLLESPKTPSAPPQRPDPNVARLEEDLSLKLGAQVLLRHDQKGKGSLVIHYNSLDELDGILAHIK
jgi:ParB family chromosome partitioning protein